MAISLKSARVNAELTQKEASKKLGIAKTTLANYEAYRTVPDMEMAKKIAALYKLKIDDIIFFKDKVC